MCHIGRRIPTCTRGSALARAVAITSTVALAAPTVGGDLATVEIETIVLNGDPVWGDPDATFHTLTAPTIGVTGALGIRATVNTESGLRQRLYIWDRGTAQFIAQEGWPAAQHPYANYDSFDTLMLDAEGRVCFKSGAMIVAGFPGDLRIVAWAGLDQNPDPDYAQGGGPLGSPLFTRGGHIAFPWGQQHRLQLWSGSVNKVVMVAADDMPVPGYPQGVVMGGYYLPVVADTGDVMATASLDGPVYSDQNLLVRAGPNEVVVLVGPAMPTPEGDGVYDSVFGVSVNGQGDVGFGAEYCDNGSGVLRRAVWVGPPSAPQRLLTLGDPAPGFPDGWTFASFGNTPSVTASGRAIVVADVTDGNDTSTGIWFWDGSAMQLRTQLGAPVINMTETTWTSFGDHHSSEHIAVNDVGQVAFMGWLDVPGAGFTYGLLLTGVGGNLYAVAASDQPFEVGPGDVRDAVGPTVIGSSPSGYACTGDDGRRTFLNDDGTVAFSMAFHDWSFGLFTARLETPSPCPADIDGDDDIVDVTDLVAVVLDWACASPAGTCTGDVNGDGVVDVLDLVEVILAWGTCPGASG